MSSGGNFSVTIKVTNLNELRIFMSLLMNFLQPSLKLSIIHCIVCQYLFTFSFDLRGKLRVCHLCAEKIEICLYDFLYFTFLYCHLYTKILLVTHVFQCNYFRSR